MGLCLPSSCGLDGLRLDHRWLELHADSSRPQNSNGRGAEDKRSRQTQQTNTSFGQNQQGLDSCFLWRMRKNRLSQCFTVRSTGSPSRVITTYTQTHAGTHSAKMIRLVKCFFFLLFFIYNSAKPGLFKDMFNKVTLASWQIFSTRVLEVALVPMYEGLWSHFWTNSPIVRWDIFLLTFNFKVSFSDSVWSHNVFQWASGQHSEIQLNPTLKYFWGSQFTDVKLTQ